MPLSPAISAETTASSSRVSDGSKQGLFRFSGAARDIMEQSFQVSQSPSRRVKEELARRVGEIDGAQVNYNKVDRWFAYQRKKLKKDALKGHFPPQWPELETFLKSHALHLWTDVLLFKLLELHKIDQEEGMRLISNLRKELEAPLRSHSHLPTPASSESPEIKPQKLSALVSPMQRLSLLPPLSLAVKRKVSHSPALTVHPSQAESLPQRQISPQPSPPLSRQAPQPASPERSSPAKTSDPRRQPLLTASSATSPPRTLANPPSASGSRTLDPRWLHDAPQAQPPVVAYSNDVMADVSSLPPLPTVLPASQQSPRLVPLDPSDYLQFHLSPSNAEQFAALTDPHVEIMERLLDRMSADPVASTSHSRHT